jgi:glutathione reductase (NADPH)
VLRLNGIYARNLRQGRAHIEGRAKFSMRTRVEVNGVRYTARAHRDRHRRRTPRAASAGRRARHHLGRLFRARARPQRVAVVGSGYVACELASAFHELGSEWSCSSARITC